MNAIEPSSPAADQATPVVTAFVWDGQRVLLALRSERVSTFSGHWAGISGYLEGSDAAAWAVIEIQQETGLAREQLTLRGVGEVLDAVDEKTGKRFLVHPLLFDVLPGTDVRLDWEAQRLEWVEVDQLLRRDLEPVVPRLFDAFEAVWPPWDPQRSIAADGMLARRYLADDRSLGAGELARRAGAEIVKLAERFGNHDFATAREALRKVIDDLKDVRPSMATPANLLADLRDALDTAEDAGDFRQWALGLLQRSRDAEERLARRVAKLIPLRSRVMTISFSSTVLRTLTMAAERLESVIVCEGRPLCEGRQLARQLAEAGVPVTLITEAQAIRKLADTDLVLLGADCVIPDRGVINKAGSAALALAAQQADKPVWVVAELLKWVRDPQEQFSVVLEEGAADEVWDDAPADVKVANVYFELVPQRWISEVIGEEPT